MNLLLCGLPGCGKSFLGGLLAARLGWDFVDVDRWMEKSYRKATGQALSCREMFRRHGESHFRSLEQRFLSALRPRSRTTVALGGGATSLESGRLLVKSLGRVIYLRTPIEVIWERMSHQPTLPAFLDANSPLSSLEALAQQRIPGYEAIADMILDTADKSVEEIIAYIENSLHGKQQLWKPL